MLQITIPHRYLVRTHASTIKTLWRKKNMNYIIMNYSNIVEAKVEKFYVFVISDFVHIIVKILHY